MAPTIEQTEAYWDKKILDYEGAMVDTVRAAAGKWQAAIAAFLGVFATVGFVWGPDKLTNFPFSGLPEWLVLGAISVGGLMGLVAIVVTNLAAQGVPKVVEGVMTPDKLRERFFLLANRSHTYLMVGIAFAGLSAVLVIGASFSVLVASATQSPAPTSVLMESRQGTLCGQLSETPSGTISVVLPNGHHRSVGGAALVPVVAC